MGKITEEEMARLTDDERAALEGDTDVMSVEEIKAAEEAAAKAAADAAMTDEERAAKKAEDDKIEEEAKAKAAADAEKAAAEQAAKEAEDKRKADDAAAAEAAEKAKAAAAPAAPDPAFVLKEQSAKTAEATAALDAKLEEGEITLAEYNKQLRDLLYADINEQVQKGAAEKSWKDSQRAFYDQNPEYSGAPIARDGDTPEEATARARAMNLTLVDAVNTILATDESKKMTDAQIFAKAKERCDGVYKPKAKSDNSAADQAAAEAAAKKKALDDAKAAELAKAAGVKTLKDVPAADSSMADDKFDMIDKLEGDAFQNAIARLSDADRAAYAARP